MLKHAGAKGEDRTRDPHFTKVVLYQLSYFGLNTNGNKIADEKQPTAKEDREVCACKKVDSQPFLL